ncbi:MAG: hypothetical protein CL666_00960 [Balneola sp.]|nr:hypothetical protein [Balneola sp.]|tara:strand:- start:82786 stop:83478 length:693 start_codon:yes stop_codon:yes gene_type:complete
MDVLKGTLITLCIGLCCFYPFNFSLGQSVSVEGRVEGTVLLAPKENPVRVGGRYGRPTRSDASSEPSTNHALIWLESSSVSNSGNPEDPVILDQKDLTFEPSILAVRQHGEVRIVNSDPVYHNVFSLSPPKRFDVGRRPKGEYLDVSFDKPGVVDVFCDIHSNMRATIYVMTPNVLTWMKVKSGESFSFENIDPGYYQLKVYALGYQENTVSIEVTEGEATDIGTLTLNF